MRKLTHLAAFAEKTTGTHIHGASPVYRSGVDGVSGTGSANAATENAENTDGYDLDPTQSILAKVLQRRRLLMRTQGRPPEKLGSVQEGSTRMALEHLLCDGSAFVGVRGLQHH